MKIKLQKNEKYSICSCGLSKTLPPHAIINAINIVNEKIRIAFIKSIIHTF
jgi:hypothetical protein